MEILFYVLSMITCILTTLVVLSIYPVYSLLFLISSFLSISCIFFMLGAFLAGAFEVIIYAGAIMVLFIFVVMMLNTDFYIVRRSSLFIQFDWKRLLLLLFFLVIHIYIWNESSIYYISDGIFRDVVTVKSVALKLFGPYILLVEMASMLLLAALLITLHIGRSNYYNLKK